MKYSRDSERPIRKLAEAGTLGRVGRFDDDVVDAQRGGRGALQVGERDVVVGLGAQLLVARVDELVLALEEEERGGAPDLVEPALARELFLRALAGLPRGEHAAAGRLDRLHRVADFDLDGLVLRARL